ALDLTQTELADQVGCSVATIRKIEGDGARPSKQIAERLADVLAISDDERAEFIVFARRMKGNQPSEASENGSGITSYHLPQQVTAFIGRTDELRQIAERLDNPACRLLTLVGPGGIGKTRLAIEAASAANFADGVYFVSLAQVSSPSMIASAIADALRFS